jgi:hypothetical protein
VEAEPATTPQRFREREVSEEAAAADITSWLPAALAVEAHATADRQVCLITAEAARTREVATLGLRREVAVAVARKPAGQQHHLEVAPAVQASSSSATR